MQPLSSMADSIFERQMQEAEEFDALNRKQRRAVLKLQQTQEVRSHQQDPRIKARQERKRKARSRKR